MANEALTLLELNKRISSLIMVSSTQNVWVTAELSDVAVRGGHCYMELLQKDAERGTTLAKARAMIWSSLYQRIEAQFYVATGQRFTTGIKVMVQVSATMHPVYGISLVISAVNPEYTMGDLLRRRREMLEKLKQEGILEMNRSLEWTTLPQRIAVVSAPGAAGYGDFKDQLYKNQARLKFKVELFPAVMQGERAPETIIAALEQIATQSDAWDCVVIIRGGGATSDLSGFDTYALAANCAQFPLPIITGIGHERDDTVIDSVVHTRVKTPTAAAEYLIGRLYESALRLEDCANRIVSQTETRMVRENNRLVRMAERIPMGTKMYLQRGHHRIEQVWQRMQTALGNRLMKENHRLQLREQQVKAASPEHLLKKGYSITLVNGKAVKDASLLKKGDTLVTLLYNGKIESEVK